MPLHVAPQLGTKYVLVNGTTRVTFNDPTDADNVGVLTNITGLDSPEVREDGESFVQADGGVHGPFLYGRRPIVLEGLVYGHVSDAHRNEKVARLLDASNAMSNDAVLSWQPLGGAAVFTSLRRQQPPKITGGWNKTFQLSMVAADPRFYSSTVNTVTKTTTTGSTVTNNGNAETFPVYTIYGPTTSNMDIQIGGKSAVKFTRKLDLADGFLIDGLNRTVVGYQRRVNWFKNPSFEHATITEVTNAPGDSSGLYATGAPTLAAVAQPTPGSGFGSKVLQITTTGIGAFPTPGSSGSERVAMAVLKADIGGAITPNAFEMPDYDIVNQTYLVVSASFARAAASPATYLPYIQAGWIDETNAPWITSGAEAQWRGTTPIDTTWQRVSVAFPIPNRTNPRFFAEVALGPRNPTGNMAAGQVWYIDGVVVEIVQGTTDSAFFYPDGVTYGWEGTADNSRTYSLVADPLFAPKANYHYVDFAGTTWGGLLPGNNTVSLPGSFTTGASLKVDWRDAWL